MSFGQAIEGEQRNNDSDCFRQKYQPSGDNDEVEAARVLVLGLESSFLSMVCLCAGKTTALDAVEEGTLMCAGLELT